MRFEEGANHLLILRLQACAYPFEALSLTTVVFTLILIVADMLSIISNPSAFQSFLYKVIIHSPGQEMADSLLHE